MEKWRTRLQTNMRQDKPFKMLKEYQKAIDGFNKVISLAYGKEPLKTYLHRGDCYLELDQKEKACADYTKAKLYGVKAAQEKLAKHCTN